jgi:hypothetical protein
MTTHTRLPVKQLAAHTWMAACSCGEHWDADSSKAANRMRNKHIHRVTAEAQKTKGGAA